MRATNHVCVEGNLAKDATLRKKKDGTSVLAFTIAQTNLHRNRATGRTVSQPYHFQCTYFGDRAEELHPMLVKGAAVLVTGELRSSEWVRDGEKRYQIDIVVRQVAFNAAQPGKAAAAKGRPARSQAASPEPDAAAVSDPTVGIGEDLVEAFAERPAAEPEPAPAPAQEAFEAEPEDDWPFDLDFDAFEEEE